jgi:hypothetical protein
VDFISYASSIDWNSIIKIILIILLCFISLSLIFTALPKDLLSSKINRKKKANDVEKLNISLSNKKRLDILFENMGQEHFKKDVKSHLLWKRIHQILKDVNYETTLIKKILSKKKSFKKNPEMYFLTQNIENLEKIIQKYETLPSLILLEGTTESQKKNLPLESKNKNLSFERPNLKLI